MGTKIILEEKPDLIYPCWHVPANIKAFSTRNTRGYSYEKNYAKLNLSLSGLDDKYVVMLNRKLLTNTIGHPINWLKQNHSARALALEHDDVTEPADAAYTRLHNTVCAVLTADCVPILLTNKKGSFAAAIHAGWKGLAKGIIANTLNKINSSDVIAWIGPCICGSCYNVGPEVRDIFCKLDGNLIKFFHERNKKIYVELSAIATFLLRKKNVSQIYNSNTCTKNPNNNLFSARRDTIYSGRIATCIWISDS